MRTSDGQQLLPFLQKTASDPRTKIKTSLQQLSRVLGQQHLIVRVNDKALFVSIMAELIHHQFTLFFLKLKVLHNQITRFNKPQAKHREDRQVMAPKRQRARKHNTSNVNIAQIASESASNPSNLQQVRKPPSENSKDSSKDSKIDRTHQEPNINFKAQIQELGHIDIEPLGMDHQLMDLDNSNNISSNSSKGSHSTIQNLSEKLKILGGDVSFNSDKNTIPKRRGIQGAGATVKNRGPLTDASLMMDQTRSGVDPRFMPVPLLKDKCRQLDSKLQEEICQQVVKRITLQGKEIVLVPDTLRRLKEFESMSNRGNEGLEQPQFSEPFFDYEAGTDLFDKEFSIPSTLSRNNPEDNIFSSILQQKISSSMMKGKKMIGLKDLQKMIKKPKAEIFLKLLWAGQRGDCMLSQANPQSFGEIAMTILER